MPYKDNMSYKEISELTPKIEQYAAVAVQNGSIDPQLYGKYDVKRGLRDVNGKGVLAGLTEISIYGHLKKRMVLPYRATESFTIADMI